MILPRLLTLNDKLDKKSHFLLGPRAVGKTTLIHQSLGTDYQIINLLRSETRLRLLQNPGDLRLMIDRTKKGIVLDEIQKVPELLDEVHDLIEREHIRFLLTGSSARKLRRVSANLLAGRARKLEMFGLVHAECPTIPLEKKLAYGSLPSVLLSDDPWSELKAYTDLYLKEEIEEEAAVRNLGRFTRFLKVSALQSGQLLNYAHVASDTGISETTVRAYFQILKDTLIGHFLEPWRESKKRKAIQTAKFYYFDSGVQASLLDRKELNRNSSEFGNALEHWMFHELRSHQSYSQTYEPISYWRSTAGHEVDFCIGDRIALETKSTQRLAERDFKGLRALQEEKVFRRHIMVSFDSQIKSWTGGIECYDMTSFLTALHRGEFNA